MKWSLEDLLSKMHDGIHRRLEDISAVSGHPGTMGDASEGLWLEFLQAYLPERYRVGKAFVVDSSGHFSEQIDVVVFDRQYTPFIFNVDGIIIVPIESVYAVFECKQVMNAEQLKYAGKKIGSVRKLTGTSLPIPKRVFRIPCHGVSLDVQDIV